ncbi:D-inositol 3-phosphate glycosyltransferase [compost metagenome]
MGLEETFKCIEDIIEAVSTLNDKGMDLDILWITPEQPQYDDSYYRNVKRIFVNPPQSQIASLYRGARLFVSASQYESFSLPVLEALSCFCPVVTTGNAGVLEYAQDSYNTLIANINDPKDLALKIERVLTDSRLSETIREHGLVTSQQFSWDEIMNRLVDYYNGCSGYTVINKSRLEDWELLISDQKLVNPQEYNKLMSLILNCEADYIQLPHLNQLIEGHQVAIWQTVAIRKERSNSKVERFLIYVHGDRKVPSVYEQAYEYFMSGSFDYAFKLFTNLFKLEEDSVERAVYAKWMILCLTGLGKVEDAEKLAHDFLEAYDDLTDVYYLLNYIHFVQFGSTHLDYENIISVIGEATAYPEFLYFGSN